MSQIFKFGISLLIVFLLFRFGMKKGREKLIGKVDGRPTSHAVQRYPVRNSNDTEFNFRSPFDNSRFLINGLPAKVDVYFSKKSVEKEVRERESQWRAKGYTITKTPIGKMQIMNAFDERSRLLRSVIMTEDPRTGKTMVIPAEVELRKAPVDTKYKTPLHPLSQPIFHIESSDLGVYSETIIAVSDASVSSIADFYQKRYTQQGWHWERPEKNTFISPNFQNFLFLKGSDELWVNAGRIEDKNKTFVYLLYNDKR